MGLGGLAFTFQILPYAISIVAASAAQFFYDRIGRRPILICSTAIQTLFMLLVAGLGSKANKTSSDVNGVVASLILFYPVSRIGLGNCGYLITSEMGGVDMRKKMMVSSSSMKHYSRAHDFTHHQGIWHALGCPRCVHSHVRQSLPHQRPFFPGRESRMDLCRHLSRCLFLCCTLCT